MFQSPFAIYRRSELRLKAQKKIFKGIPFCVKVFFQLSTESKELQLQAVHIVIYIPLLASVNHPNGFLSSASFLKYYSTKLHHSCWFSKVWKHVIELHHGKRRKKKETCIMK